MNFKKIIAKASSAEYGLIYSRLLQELPYKTPQAFYRWEEISSIGALAIGTSLKGDEDESGLPYDILGQWWRIFIAGYPLYCLSAELVESFGQTEDPRLQSIIPEDWNPPFSMLCLLIQSGTIKHPTQECFLANIFVNSQKTEGVWWVLLSASYNDGSVLSWKGSLGADGIDVDANGYEEYLQPILPHVKSLLSISIQALLTITYMPELVEDGSGESRAQGFSKSKSSQKILYPRWIGKHFVRQKRASSSIAGTGSKKSAHWRRWHWRKQRYGKGNKLVKLIRIETSHIGSDAALF